MRRCQRKNSAATMKTPTAEPTAAPAIFAWEFEEGAEAAIFTKGSEVAYSVVEVETDVDFVNDPLKKEVKDEETGEVSVEVDIEVDIKEDVNVVDG